MSYIEDEALTGDGAETTFTLANAFKPGTVKVLIDDKLTYEFYEVNGGADIKFDFAPLATQTILVNYYTSAEPNTLNAFRYLTPAQAKVLSRVSSVTSATDATLEDLIREAEFLVDEYIGFFYKRLNLNTGQQLMFPRTDDENRSFDDFYPVDYVGIPIDVTRGTLAAVENLLLEGSLAHDSGAGAIISERLGDYSYTRDKGSGASTDVAILIGRRARAYLQKYKKRYRGLSIKGERSDTSLLNSRQRYKRGLY